MRSLLVLAQSLLLALTQPLGHRLAAGDIIDLRGAWRQQRTEALFDNSGPGAGNDGCYRIDNETNNDETEKNGFCNDIDSRARADEHCCPSSVNASICMAALKSDANDMLLFNEINCVKHSCVD